MSERKRAWRNLAVVAGVPLLVGAVGLLALLLCVWRPYWDWFSVHKFVCRGPIAERTDWPPDWYPSYQAGRIPKTATDMHLIWGGRDPFTYLRFGADEGAATRFAGRPENWDETNLRKGGPSKPCPWFREGWPEWWRPTTTNDGFYGIHGGSGAGAYFFYDRASRTVYYMNWTS